MSKKVKIHEFSPAIYPIKLWVVISNNGEGIFERFIDAETKKEFSPSVIHDYEALTCYVQCKESPTYYGVLIITTSKKYLTVNNMAHEAVHATKFIWKHIGEIHPGEEAEAYLVGWITGCINTVRNG